MNERDTTNSGEVTCPGRDPAVRPGVAGALVAAFLAAVAGVPLADIGREVLEHRRGARVQPLPTVCELGSVVLDAAFTFGGTGGSLRDQATEAIRVLALGQSRYAGALAESSWLHRRLRPALQAVLARRLGAGGNGVLVGRDGWLFAESDVAHVTGRDFLDRRDGSAGPVGAIVQFRDYLARRKIHLVVVPVPGRASLHPELFSRRFDGAARGACPRNAAWAQFAAVAKDCGVDVVDLSSVLRDRAGGPPAYEATDSRWCEVYTEAPAGPGTGGLAEHLTSVLGRPVDLMTRSGGGAISGRQMVIDALARDPARMQSKRILIWVFAESELSFGDWRLLALPGAEAPGAGSGALR